MNAQAPPPVQDGRPLGWRLGMVVGGAALGGIGYALLRWPQILIWTAAGCFFLLGAVLALSGLCARGRR